MIVETDGRCPGNVSSVVEDQILEVHRTISEQDGLERVAGNALG